MTAAQHAAGSASEDARPASPSAMYSASDFDTISLLFEGYADSVPNGEVKLLPLDKRGRPFARDLSPEKLSDLEGAVTDMATAERLCVTTYGLVACDPASTFMLYHAPQIGHGDNLLIKPISGPSGDLPVARALIFRALGVKERDPHLAAIREAAGEAANDNEPAGTPAKPAYPLPPMHPDPWTPEAASGLLGNVARWISSTAIIPVPELSVASALALLGGMFGDRALGPTRSGLNLFITTLMETAGGKGHPPKAMRALADLSGRPGAVTNGDPTSYAAIERMLRKNRSTVVVLDEFGVTLQDVNARHANSAAASIRKFCLAIYDQSNSKFEGRAYASAEAKKDESPIDGPALTLLGMTTPQTLYAGLSEAAISDGFLNRFLFLEGTAPAEIKPPALHRDGRPPEPLVEALRDAVSNFPRAEGNIASLLEKIIVPFEGDEGGDAHQRWQNVFMWEKANPWADGERHINGRAAENTIRLATVRAVSRDPASPFVTVEDIDWGFAIVHRSIEIISAGCARHMSASPAEALRKAIVEALRNAKDHTLPFSQLLQRSGVRGGDSRTIADALRWLGDTGEVVDLAGRPIAGRGSRLKLMTTN